MTKEQEICSIVQSIGLPHLIREREFIENLFVGRYNHFLIVFSLFMTAGFANAVTTHKSLVFYVGAVLLILVWLPLFRGYQKHDQIMRIIFRLKERHPANAIERIMKLDGYDPQYKVSVLIGIVVPWVCIITLLSFAIAFTCG